MRTTVTVRIDDALRTALEEQAESMGTTVSEVVRRTLREALEERTLAERIGPLKGTLRIEPDADAWRAHVRDRNWRS